MDEQKRRLRAAIGSRRRALSHEERAVAGAAIARIACALPEFERAERVAAYVALDDEAPTRAIVETVLASGRMLLLPRVVATKLEFAPVEDPARLRRGGFGVLEPTATCAARELARGDLVFVPGVAFDRCGGRLGRGGGHYDRAFPPAASAPILFGLAFSFQIVDVVPVGLLDRRVEGIVSDQGLVRVSPSPRDPKRDPG